jgi:hypothetical protein
LETAVALSVFDRPDTTRRVFAAIAAARPRRLFVFADGPRSPEEARRCELALAETTAVDWDCDVQWDVADENLGARLRYSSGVDWVFSEVDEAIVLDDDCLPDPTFFRFCEELLDRYRHDPRVMMVCGTNYLERWQDDRQSYHFSCYGGVWGWATWKRAWHLYDRTLSDWGDEQIRARVQAFVADEEHYAIQAARFDRLYADPTDRHSWDLPWLLTRLSHEGLTVVPAVNLVENLGNTDGRGLPPAHPLARLPMGALLPPLRPPAQVAPDREYDRRHIRRIIDWWDEQARRAQAARPSRARRVARRLGHRLQRGDRD